MNSFAASAMLDKEEVAEILNHLNDSGGSTVAEISRLFEGGTAAARRADRGLALQVGPGDPRVDRGGGTAGG